MLKNAIARLIASSLSVETIKRNCTTPRAVISSSEIRLCGLGSCTPRRPTYLTKEISYLANFLDWTLPLSRVLAAAQMCSGPFPFGLAENGSAKSALPRPVLISRASYKPRCGGVSRWLALGQALAPPTGKYFAGAVEHGGSAPAVWSIEPARIEC